MTPDQFARALAGFKANTPEGLNAELLARVVEVESRIVELEAELARHRAGHAASVLAVIADNAHNAEMVDQEFREFVRRSAR